MAEWTCDANDALAISLVRAELDAKHACHNFHPTFTYPIFGEEEKIYGYKDLSLNLQMASGSLATRLSIDHAGKLGSQSTTDDVLGTFSKFLPADFQADLSETDFRARVEGDAKSFKPFGDRVHLYKRKGKGKAGSEEEVEYEVFHSTFATPGFREYHRRMQLFVLLYIEAGSYIDEEEDDWDFMVLYEKRQRQSEPGMFTYHFVGYSSLYHFFYFPDRIRLRLSQFIILPPYQRQAHGSELYSAIYNYVVASPGVAELTVEDPAEAFEDLRDRNDMKMLLANERFMQEGFGPDALTSIGTVNLGKRKRAIGKGKMGPPVDAKWAEKWRLDLKLAGRQFHRLTEMLTLFHLTVYGADEKTMRAFRLQVKERLYRFNYEILVQLERDERLEKLEETYQSVCADYLRLLGLVEGER